MLLVIGQRACGVGSGGRIFAQMASSLDNQPTRDGFCVRSSDTEVLVMEEYYTLDDFAEECDFQFEEDDIMVEVLGSNVYVDGVCADGNMGDCSFDAGTGSKSPPCRDLSGSVEGIERSPRGHANRAESITGESSVRVSEEGVAAKDSGAFPVSDLVWVKIEIHQWWPGQIAIPSEDPSQKAASCRNRDLFLVAYFGDHSFSWHEASSLKPFIPFFPEAVLHRNSELFRNAVDCALAEFSRQLQSGLTCSCLPKNADGKVICPNVVDGRTTKVLGARDTVNDLTSARSFKPKRLLEYINLLARLPFGEVDQLELVVSKAQLLCFYRHNGYKRVPEVQYCRELMESDESEGNFKDGLTSFCEEGCNVPNSPPHRLWPDWNDICDLSRKERSLAELMAAMAESFEEASPSRKKHRSHDPSIISSIADGKKSSLNIGEFSQGATTQLSDSLAIERSRNGECAPLNGFEFFFSDSGDIRFPEESSLDGLFGQIQFEATNASEVRGRPSEAFQLEDTNDSYWTDRIIETNDGGTMIEESRSLRKFDRVELSSIDGDCLVVDNNSPAELVLLFPETGSFPCEASLNKTLKMFGPLKESKTRVDRKSRCSRVVFRKFNDAKVAFSSAQKYSIFGPAAVKYQLNCPISEGHCDVNYR